MSIIVEENKETNNKNKINKAINRHIECMSGKSEINVCSEYFFNDVKPLFYVLRLLGRFPFCVNKEGRLAYRLFSIWTLCTNIVYIPVAYFAIYNIVETIHYIRLEECKFDVTLLSSISILFLINFLCGPIIIIVETKCLVRLVNRWKDYQMELHNFFQCKPVSLRKYIVISILIMVPIELLLILMESGVLRSNSWLQIIPYFCSFTIYNVYLICWMAYCFKIRMVSKQINDYLEELFILPLRPNIPDKLRCIRQFWINLISLTHYMGQSLTISFTVAMVTSFATLVIASYALIFHIVSGKFLTNFDSMSFLSLIIVTTVYVILFAEISHRVSDELGPKLIGKISNINTSTLNNDINIELNLFLQTINLNSTDITLNGFVTINRGTCTAILSNIVTYLIVLIQFNKDED